MRISKLLKRFSALGLTACAGCSLKWIILENSLVLADATTGSVPQDENPEKSLQLKHVQVLFRHGARTPLHLTPGVEQVFYHKDLMLRPAPHTMVKLNFINFDGQPLKASRFDSHYEKLKLKGGCNGGLLTTFGQDQMYTLGKRLKKDYQHFIDSYNPKLVKMKTTHMKRTKESLRCVVAGMFGLENLKGHEPITVESNDTNDMILVPCPNICPVFRQINHAAMIHGPSLPEFQDDVALLENLIGKKYFSKKRVHFIDVRDDFVARKTHGLPLPDFVTEDVYKMVDRNASRLMYYAQCGQHEAERILATRLSVGRLVNRFLENIQNSVEGTSEVKLHLYSAHDSTVLPVLEAFGLDALSWPPFAADISVELYESSDKQYFVKVKYLGKVQQIRGCDTELCPLNQFILSVSPYAIDQEEFVEVCHSNILEVIAAEMLAQEEGEIEDEESKDRSDYAAGM